MWGIPKGGWAARSAAGWLRGCSPRQSLPFSPPDCKILFCQWVLAALWHRFSCFGSVLGPWHVPGHQGTLLGELLLIPQPLPLHSVESAQASCWAQLGEQLFHRDQGWTPRPKAERKCRGNIRLGEQSEGLGQRQLSSSSPEVFGAENNEPAGDTWQSCQGCSYGS